MQSLTKYRTHAVSVLEKLARLDTRLKLVGLLVVALFLLTRTSVVVINFPRLLWLGKDTCSAWRGKALKRMRLTSR